MKVVTGFLVIMLASASAFSAPEIILECQVPTEQVRYSAIVFTDRELVPEKEVIGIVLLDTKENKQDMYQNLSETGVTVKQMAAGALQIFGFGAAFAQEDGIIKDVASLNLSYNELNEVFEGMFAAKGNLYPVICKKPKVENP